MILKVLTFIAIYLLIKNILKSVFGTVPPQNINQPNNSNNTPKGKSNSDIIDAEFKVLKDKDDN